MVIPKKVARSLKSLSGALESYWWLRLKVGGESGFQQRWKQWTQWIEEFDRVVNYEPSNGRRILVFGAAYSWLDFSFATAVVLSAYGPEVDYVWLPYTNWGPGDDFQRQKRYESWARKHRPPLESKRLKLYNCLNLPLAQQEAWMEQEATQLACLDTQYEARTEEVDTAGTHSEIFLHRKGRNLRCIQSLSQLFREQRYDKVIVANGQVMELGAAYRTARHYKIPCTTFEIFERQGFLGFNDTRPASNADTSQAWSEDAPHMLDQERLERVTRLLAGREGTSWEGYCVAAQTQAKSGADKLRRELQISTHKVALCCPNVSWDSSVLGVGQAFPTMVSWLRHVADYFSRDPDWTLIVRCHPGERFWGTSQPSEGVIRELFPDRLPDNLRVISAQDDINTYGLMDIAQLGLVYTSTTGLEMAARKIPVITAGWVHYAKKGFTFDPVSLEQYDQCLSELLKGPESLTQEQQNRVFCYLDVYFYLWPRAFPWHTNFWTDIQEWSISRIISSEGQALFRDTFLFLASDSRGQESQHGT